MDYSSPILMMPQRVKPDFAPPQPGAPAATAAQDPPPRIGPNSVIQTLRALAELEPPEVSRLVQERAELPDTAPKHMIPEAWFVRLVQALRATLPADRAEAVLRRSGAYTAEYVSQNRIPAPLRGLFRVLPARLAIPLLLSAFRRHAWTFAGGGHFHVEGAYPGTIVLDGCPTCRADTADPALGHAGAYYEAAFEGLLRLASRDVRVREVACQASHAPLCRFQIGEHSCASS